MSYARWGQNGSNVYVFGSTYEGRDVIVCCGCLLVEDEDGSARFDTPDEMLTHLERHLRAGHVVPPRCLLRLAQEAAAVEG